MSNKALLSIIAILLLGMLSVGAIHGIEISSDDIAVHSNDR